MDKENQKAISVSKFADLFAISRQYAYDLVKENKIKSIRLGSAIRIPYSEVLRLEGSANEES